MTAPKTETALDDIRREIDTIDDAILDLLVRRFQATSRVRAAKSSDGSITMSPLRPAREATLLRRIMQAGQGKLSPELLVRLWRVILSASTQSQAPITLHVDESLAADLRARLLINEHFCGMPVRAHGGLGSAFATLMESRGDLAVVAAASEWAGHFAALPSSTLQLIGCLPVIESGGAPDHLVFGHAEPQSSGEDVTVMLSPAREDAEPETPTCWQVVSGKWRVIALEGFLTEGHPALRRYLETHPGSRVAGRYPRSIEVGT